MNKVEIYINDPSNYTLDVGDFDMSFNYSFNDIRDIAKRNGSFSKTLTLPGTKNNNIVFGGLFDINSDYTLFNPNIKVRARVMTNSKIIMNGFLTLNSIDKLSNIDSQGNEIYYNVSIFSRSIDLFESLGDKSISNLNLDTYNHIYDESSIVQSWNNTYLDGYVYPMYPSFIEPNTVEYSVEDFYPAVFSKMILDRIISEAGFSWAGSLKNNFQFENEIYPFTGGNEQISSDSELSAREAIRDLNIDNLIKFSDDINSATTVVTNIIDYNNIIKDNSNQFVSSTIFESGFFQYIKFNIIVDFEIFIEHKASFSVETSSIDPFKLKSKVFLRKNGSTTISEFELKDIFFPLTIQPNSIVTSTPLNISFITDEILEPTDQIEVIIQVIRDGGVDYENLTSGIPILEPSIELKGASGEVSFTTDVDGSKLYVGSTVRLNRFFPNIKQKDVITDLIKRYNLLIYTDPINPNLLLFDTYNDYFDNSEILDWSDKKDYSKEDNIELLTDLQADNILFTYTKDEGSATLNEVYTNATSEIFGEYELLIKDYSSNKEQKIQTPFAPCPSLRTIFGAILPSISRDDPSGLPKVLYYGGLKDTINSRVFNFEGTNYTQYPYAGHLSDPFLPTYDLNFDVARYYFYDGIQITFNNHFNTYWSSYVSQIKNGKLLTSYFYLNEIDIEKVKDNFSYKIWVKDSYFYINRIIDYNPLKNGLTKVELLKVNDLGGYYDSTPPPIPTSPNCPVDIFVDQQIFNNQTYYFYASTSGATVSQSCCSDLGGIWDAASNTCFLRNAPRNLITNTLNIDNDTTTLNSKVQIGSNTMIGQYSILVNDNNGLTASLVKSSKQFMIGDDNHIAGDINFIVGNNNTISSSNISLLNSDNNVAESSNITAIGTKGLTLSTPNSTYIGQEIKIDNITGDIIWQGSDVLLPTPYEIIKTSRVTINSNDIKSLYTTPIDLISAPESSEYIDVLSAVMNMVYKTTPYEQDITLSIECNNSQEALFIGNSFLGATYSGLYKFNQIDSLNKKPQIVPGERIYITTPTDNPTTGDSDIEIILTYRIVS